jgi:hypothetical protein
MTKTNSTRFAVFAASLIVVTLPAVAAAQEAPAAPPVRDSDIQTGTRIQTITVIGAIRDTRAPQRAERSADRRLPVLPVTYDDGQPTK